MQIEVYKKGDDLNNLNMTYLSQSSAEVWIQLLAISDYIPHLYYKSMD